MTDDSDPSICGRSEKCSELTPISQKLVIGASKKPARASSPAKKTSNTPVLAHLVRLAVILIAQIPVLYALPVPGTLPPLSSHYANGQSLQPRKDDPDFSLDADPSSFWTNLIVSCILVLLGGVFAGLTLGLMGQDEVYLQVIKQSGEPNERKAASKVLGLLSRGKHWVLVTLLLSNVLTNETLPIVLDRCLGGGWPAVVASSGAIVIFGEIIPQSISVRYGLSVGAAFAPFVLCLMYVLYPLAYPIALLLDRILGQDHGTIYKRAGLKSLVTLHKSMDVEGLNEDEVTIISAVLDLKQKPVSSIMTPIDDVFVLSADTVLNEATVEKILYVGFNRIPIHQPGEPSNFIGMLLVRTLITYDPEDALPISSFPLATLPETAPDSSCLNILNYFQEGKSHMVVVSNHPGEAAGAIGVLTLEDVIEELIGEEIVDESDVFVDVHKAIRRVHPSPLAKKGTTTVSGRGSLGYDSLMNALAHRESLEHQQHTYGADGKPTNANAPETPATATTDTSAEVPRIKLGPSNKASDPRILNNKHVTVKRLSHLREQSLDGDLIDTDENTSSQSLTIKSPHDEVMDDAGAIHRTEFGAVRAALSENEQRHEGSSYSEYANAGDLVFEDRSTTRPSGVEVHSYRAGSIVESVINVKGVNKVIIEDDSKNVVSASDSNSEDNDDRSTTTAVIVKAPSEVSVSSASSTTGDLPRTSSGRFLNGNSIKKTGKRIFGNKKKTGSESKPLMGDQR